MEIESLIKHCVYGITAKLANDLALKATPGVRLCADGIKSVLAVVNRWLGIEQNRS